MPGIWNVNKVYDVSTNNRINGKLSFAVGEAFLARLVKTDEKNSELLLKLLDGWQFSAKLEQALEFIPKGLIKFEVVGFEEGKLIIKPVLLKDEEKESELSSIDSALEEQNINMDKSEYEILQKMIKHNMPLTKDNISRIKTLVDFKGKIASNPEEEEKFIIKYLNSKGIEANSDKGKEIINSLKGFFKELKNISEEDLLTLIENGIEVNEENIKSFNRVVKESGTIYKDSQKIAEGLKQGAEAQKAEIQINEAEEKVVFKGNSAKDEVAAGLKLDEVKGDEVDHSLNRESIKGSNSTIDNTRKDIIKGEKLSDSNKEVVVSKNTNDEEKSIVSSKNIGENTEDVSDAGKKTISHEKEAANKNNILLNDRDSVKLVKEQIGNKTAEIKEVLKNLLEDKLNLKPELYNKVMEGIKENINDFKVFNSISNEYYYLDMPLKFKDSEYGCKFMIKDERGKGKKVDSKNVKVVVSVNTGSMGMIDSYIKVVNNIMNIDIKCEEPWVKILDAGKEKVLKDVSNIGYSVSVNVSKRVQEANLVNCRGFFEDNNIHSINTKV